MLLLHGWPGDRTDYRAIVPLLADFDVVVPDLRGFGGSDKHRAAPAEYGVDGQARGVLGLIAEFGLDHWSGPGFSLPADHLDHLVTVYSPPGAFTASIGWYRAGAGAVARSLTERAPDPADRLATPTTVLWPEHDPLFPPAWSDRLADFFADVHLQHLDVGHFTPLESPEQFAAAIRLQSPAR